jgi:hypothetical protein
MVASNPVTPTIWNMTAMRLARWLSLGLLVGMACAPTKELSAGTWSLAASMTTPRGSGHSVTLLLNGKVLVAGGSSQEVRALDNPVVFCGKYLSSAEVYDPTSDTWAPAASMSRPRGFHRTVRLPSGKVLAIGSAITYERYPNDPGLDYDSTAEIYDPDADTWSDAGRLPVPRTDFAVAMLRDGRTLAIGGWRATPGASAEASNALDIYDPATNAWRPARPSAGASFKQAPFGTRAVTLADDRVLVVWGGESQDSATNAEIYDPLADAWTPVAPPLVGPAPSPSTPALFGAAQLLLLPSGEVLSAGSQIYSPTSNSWRPAAPTKVPPGGAANDVRFHFYAAGVWLHPTAFISTLLADGRVFALGPTAAQLFDPASNEWSETDPRPSGPVDAPPSPVATVLRSGKVLVVGGRAKTLSAACTAVCRGACNGVAAEQATTRAELFNPR